MSRPRPFGGVLRASAALGYGGAASMSLAGQAPHSL